MLVSLLSFYLSFLRTTTQVRLENLFLRKQIEILARTSTKPRFRTSDRFFFGTMTGIFDAWKDALLLVKPETIIRWHRQGFKLYWKWKSRSGAGRTKIPQEQIDLIKQMTNDNPLWGAPRIHGEMLKLGINKDSPEPREVQADGEIERVALVNGLHHYYFRRAA